MSVYPTVAKATMYLLAVQLAIGQQPTLSKASSKTHVGEKALIRSSKKPGGETRSGHGELAMPPCAETTLPGKIKQLRPAVVEILVNGKRNGSGFFVTPNGLTLTAMHVVGQIVFRDQRAVPSYFPKIEIVLYDGRKVPAEPVFNSDTHSAALHDIAVLKCTLETPSFLSIGSYKEVIEGGEVYFMGFPIAVPNAVTYRGTVSAKVQMPSIEFLPGITFRHDSIFLQSPAARGFSGSPLLTSSDDKVVGIVTTKLVGITNKLSEAREQIKQSQAAGSRVLFGGVDPLESIKELIDILDNYLNVGVGGAVSIDYVATTVKQSLAAVSAEGADDQDVHLQGALAKR